MAWFRASGYGRWRGAATAWKVEEGGVLAVGVISRVCCFLFYLVIPFTWFVLLCFL